MNLNFFAFAINFILPMIIVIHKLQLFPIKSSNLCNLRFRLFTLVVFQYLLYGMMLFIHLTSVSFFTFGSLMIILSFGLPLTIIDSLYYRLPNQLVYSLFIVSFCFCILFSPHNIGEHALSSLIVFCLLLLLSIMLPNSLGGGDIKLMGSLAVLIGFKNSVETLFISSIIGICCYLLFIGEKETALPFGPFLLFGAYVSLLF